MNICGRNEAENDSGDDRMLWSAGLHPTFIRCPLALYENETESYRLKYGQLGFNGRF